MHLPSLSHYSSPQGVSTDAKHVRFPVSRLLSPSHLFPCPPLQHHLSAEWCSNVKCSITFNKEAMWQDWECIQYVWYFLSSETKCIQSRQTKRDNMKIYSVAKFKIRYSSHLSLHLVFQCLCAAVQLLACLYVYSALCQSDVFCISLCLILMDLYKYIE